MHILQYVYVMMCSTHSTSLKSNKVETYVTLYTETQLDIHTIYAALRDHMRIVFEAMSSWTALTGYIGMKTTF